mgnify:CR=1 FL=1
MSKFTDYFPTAGGGGGGGSAINQYASFHVIPSTNIFTGVFNSSTNRMQLPSDYEQSTSGGITVLFTFYSLAGEWLGTTQQTANQGNGSNDWLIVDFVSQNPGVLVNGTSYYVSKSTSIDAAFTTGLDISTNIYKPSNGTDEYIRTGYQILQGTSYLNATTTGVQTLLNGRTSTIPGVDQLQTNHVGPQLDFKLAYGNGGFWRFNWVKTGFVNRGSTFLDAATTASVTATPLTLTGTTWTEGTPITIISGNSVTLNNPAGFVPNNSGGAGGFYASFAIYDIAWDAFNNKWAFLMWCHKPGNSGEMYLNRTDTNFLNATGNQLFTPTPSGEITKPSGPQTLAVNPVNGEFLITRTTTSNLSAFAFIFDGSTFTRDVDRASPSSGFSIAGDGHTFIMSNSGFGSRKITKSNSPLTSPGQTLEVCKLSTYTSYYDIPATVPNSPYLDFTQNLLFDVNDITIILSDFTSFNIPDSTISTIGQNIDTNVPLVGDPTVQTPDYSQNGLLTTPLVPSIFLKIT